MYSFIPLVARAAGDAANPSVKALVYRVSAYVLNPLIAIGFVVALLYFMWGIVEYVKDRDSGHLWNSSAFGKEGKGTEGADRIVYGLFGLFIMVSVFGILRLLKSLIGADVYVG